MASSGRGRAAVAAVAARHRLPRRRGGDGRGAAGSCSGLVSMATPAGKGGGDVCRDASGGSGGGERWREGKASQGGGVNPSLGGKRPPPAGPGGRQEAARRRRPRVPSGGAAAAPEVRRPPRGGPGARRTRSPPRAPPGLPRSATARGTQMGRPAPGVQDGDRACPVRHRRVKRGGNATAAALASIEVWLDDCSIWQLHPLEVLSCSRLGKATSHSPHKIFSRAAQVHPLVGWWLWSSGKCSSAGLQGVGRCLVKSRAWGGRQRCCRGKTSCVCK